MHVVAAVWLLAKLFFLVPDQTQEIPADVSMAGVYLHATINGHPAVFHLDSGSEAIVLDPGAAARLGIKDGVADVDIGPLHASNVRFWLHDYSNTQNGVPVVGIIGYQFFRSNPVTIDYPHHKLIVHGADFDPRALGTPQPIEPIDNGKAYLVHVWFAGKRATMLLDTGDFHTMLFPDFAKQVRGLDEGTVIVDFFGGRRVPAEVYDVGDVNFGGVLGKSAEIVVPNPMDYPPNPQYDGILGRDLLSRVVLTIDYEDDALFVQTP
ncbi:MAG TPA: retropepsin-like aspartic protease [Candidatus Acidoferrum sp.]|nr:retropepsin-like aspartic protease [Candidatus Acidoferrum sp.]